MRIHLLLDPCPDIFVFDFNDVSRFYLLIHLMLFMDVHGNIEDIYMNILIASFYDDCFPSYVRVLFLVDNILLSSLC